MAKLLNAPINECVFVENSTNGINTVLRNIVFRDGDVIVYFSTVYGAVDKTVISLSETSPVRGLKIGYQYPITDDELVGRFLKTVKKAKVDGLNVRVTIFDTIVSLPGIRFPFERLVEASRKEGVLSLVDGAHGIGQIPIDLGKLQPDFFISNCHK
jgi:selenocysteine lyase/cysteine desulfurase